MTTWLPPAGVDLPDFLDTLHRAHLGAQQGPEGLVVVRALLFWEHGVDRGYQRHVATRMWRGHLHALAEYQVEVARAWERRYGPGSSGTLREYEAVRDHTPDTGWPRWWRRSPLHEQHVRSLIERKPEHYGPLYPGVLPHPEPEPFLWPGDPQDYDAADRLAAQIDTWRAWRAQERQAA